MMPNKPTKPDKSFYHLELLIIFVVERFFDFRYKFCQILLMYAKMNGMSGARYS